MGPAEEEVLEVGGGGEHQNCAPKPHFQIAFQLFVGVLHAEDPPQQKAKDRNGHEAGDDPDDRAQYGLKNEIAEQSGDVRRHGGDVGEEGPGARGNRVRALLRDVSARELCRR